MPDLMRALKAYRARRGLSQSKAAEHFGVTRDWVRQAESPRVSTGPMAQVLAACLDRL